MIWCGRVGEVLQSTLCLGTLGMPARAGRDKIWVWLTQGAPALGWHQNLCSPSSGEAPGHPGDSLGVSTIHPITAGVQGWGSCCCPGYPVTQVWFFSVELHLHQQIHQTICAHVALGALSLDLDALSGFIAIVLPCSLVLDILMQNIR